MLNLDHDGNLNINWNFPFNRKRIIPHTYPNVAIEENTGKVFRITDNLIYKQVEIYRCRDGRLQFHAYIRANNNKRKRKTFSLHTIYKQLYKKPLPLTHHYIGQQ